MMDKEGSKRVEISGANDKRQITAVFYGSLTSDFLLLQLIYKVKSPHCQTRFQFPSDLHVTYSPKHWYSGPIHHQDFCSLYQSPARCLGRFRAVRSCHYGQF